jgi:hypothetical protein
VQRLEQAEVVVFAAAIGRGVPEVKDVGRPGGVAAAQPGALEAVDQLAVFVAPADEALVEAVDGQEVGAE